MMNEPKIIAFLCNWCSYAGADLAGVSRLQYPHNIRIIRVLCSGRMDPVFIFDSLSKGVDGVLVGGCHPGDCHYIEGNIYTSRRWNSIVMALEFIGVEKERVRLEWISAAEGEKFAAVMKDFVNDVKRLGSISGKNKNGENIKFKLECVAFAFSMSRVRELTSKEIKLTEKGNVYGDIISEEKYGELLRKTLEDEIERAMILKLSKSPLSIKGLANVIGISPSRVLSHVSALTRKRMMRMCEIKERTPLYMSEMKL